jgi:hypothetical protein
VWANRLEKIIPSLQLPSDFMMRFITSVAYAEPFHDELVFRALPQDEEGCGYHPFYRIWANHTKNMDERESAMKKASHAV